MTLNLDAIKKRAQEARKLSNKNFHCGPAILVLADDIDALIAEVERLEKWVKELRGKLES